jgi:hypothetical protein
VDRAGCARLLALCWIGFVLVFFTFSTTQEYYSMPIYPALALLTGCAMAAGGDWIRRGTRTLSAILFLAALIAMALWFRVRNLPAPGDISQALSLHPAAYTLSLGHIEDLTFRSLAYLRAPLLMAAIAWLVGAVGTMRAVGKRTAVVAQKLLQSRDRQGAVTRRDRQGAVNQDDTLTFAFLSAAVMAVLFFQAARMALVAFDPFMSSRPLAQALLSAPPGKLVVDHHYYTFSSIFFYTNKNALLLNGRINNLVYGSYAPGAPDVFIDDQQWKRLWSGLDRYYLVASRSALPRLEALAGRERINVVAESGGKLLLTNQSLLNAHNAFAVRSLNAHNAFAVRLPGAP